MENMNANAAKANDLMNLARNTYIGIDTNIFMHASADAFFSNLERTLNELNRAGDSGKRYRVFTIGEVKAELEKQSRVPRKQALAGNGLRWLERLVRQDLLCVYVPQTAGKNFADSGWTVLLGDMRISHRLSLITQDRDLAADVIELVNGARSVHGNLVNVRRVNSDGNLSCFRFEYDGSGRISAKSFRPRQALAADDFSLPAVSVDEGDSLFDERGRTYVLGECINYGSEAAIFAVEGHGELVAKIFSETTNHKFLKCRYLASLSEIEGAVLPRSLLTTADGGFAGYLMKRIEGKQMLSFFSTRSLERNAPHWNRRDFVLLAKSLLELAGRMEQNGVLIGDVSPSNFLVGRDAEGNYDPRQVSAIDVDSAQVAAAQGTYAADGLTRIYAAPEYQEALPENRLRSASSFHYSVALLATQLILGGIHPFRVSSDDPELSVERAIALQQFPFGSAETRRAGVAPSGAEKLWSNMPKGIKTLLCDMFKDGGALNDPGKRPSLGRIEAEFDYYLRWMDEPSNRRRYPEITSLAPARMKPFYAVCAAEGCDAEFVVESFNPANRYFCPACYESWRNAVAEYRVCASCHRPFALRNFERRDNPRICPECRKREREAALQPADALCGPEPENARPSDAFRAAPADSPSSQRPAFYKTLKAIFGK